MARKIALKNETLVEKLTGIIGGGRGG